MHLELAGTVHKGEFASCMATGLDYLCHHVHALYNDNDKNPN